MKSSTWTGVLMLAHIVVHRRCAEAPICLASVESRLEMPVFAGKQGRRRLKSCFCHKMYQCNISFSIQTLKCAQMRLHTILSTYCVQKCLNGEKSPRWRACLFFVRHLKSLCFQAVRKSCLRLLTQLSTECVCNLGRADMHPFSVAVASLTQQNWTCRNRADTLHCGIVPPLVSVVPF